MKTKLLQDVADAAKPASKPYHIHDEKLPGFLLRVEVSGRRTFYVQYRHAGRQTMLRIGNAELYTVAKARTKARALLLDVAEGRDPAAARRAARRKASTLREFINGDYGEWAATAQRDGAATCKRMLTVFAEFADTPLDRITPRDVDAWATRTQDKGGNSPATVRRNVATLKAALNKAVAWGDISANPLKDYTAGKPPESRTRSLSPDEEHRLFAALDAREERLRAKRDDYNAAARHVGIPEEPDLRSAVFADALKPAVILSLLTGLRKGELLKLEWRDIDFPNRLLTVRAENAKSGKARHVPLNPDALMTLKVWRDQTTSTALVFTAEDGAEERRIENQFRGLLKAAKILGFRWHDLRHCFASKLVSAGKSLYTVQQVLGHASPLMTQRYGHLSDSARADAVAAAAIGDLLLFPKQEG